VSLYLDSAYVAKSYVDEPDSAKVRGLVRGETALYSSAWCLAEVACALHRHVREGSLTKQQASKLAAIFRADVDEGVWLLMPVSDALLRKVEIATRNLPRDVFLRAGDAVHLVSARDAGFSEIWTNDRHLLAAAPHFGLRGRTV
jgi:predicted nucleic acid-binding protein